MRCRICGGGTSHHFLATVLRTYSAEFRYCRDCDHVFAAEPHWLQEAYSDAIVRTDTDIAARNVFTALRIAAVLFVMLEERGDGVYADIAGGYGLLTRLMRDLGFQYYWRDPYAQNLFARGFEYSATRGRCRAVSAIEVLEHTVNPLEFLRDSLSTCDTDTIIFTTQVFDDKRPPPADRWDYYSFQTGQHISFFSRAGIQRLGARIGLSYYALGRLHLLTSRPVRPLRLQIAASRVLALPLALVAARRLGSKRSSDRYMLEKHGPSGAT